MKLRSGAILAVLSVLALQGLSCSNFQQDYAIWCGKTGYCADGGPDGSFGPDASSGDASSGTDAAVDAGCGLAPLLATCAADTDCCSAWCFQQRCAGAGSCSSNANTPCPLAHDCCAGLVCTAGQCLKPPADSGIPSQVVFVTPAQTVTAGSCDNAQVELADPNGVAVNAAADAVLTLAAGPGASIGFFSDSTCQRSTSTCVIAGGHADSGFWFRDTVSEQSPVIVSTGALTPANQTETINAGPASRFFITSGSSVIAGGCGGPVGVDLEDSWGNPAQAPSDLSWTVTSTPLGLKIYSENTCAFALPLFPTGATTQSFFFTSTAVQNYQGQALLADGGFGSNAVTLSTLDAGSPQLVFTVAPPSLSAGGCDRFNIEAQDNGGSALPVAQTTTVLVPDPSVSLFSDSVCTNGLVSADIPATAADVTFYARACASNGTQVLFSASAPGYLSHKRNYTLATPGAPGAITISAGDGQNVPVGSCSPLPVTVLLTDNCGNKVNWSGGGPLYVSLASQPYPMTFTYGASCGAGTLQVPITPGSSSVDFSFQGGTPSPEVIQLTPGSGLTGTTSSQTITGSLDGGKDGGSDGGTDGGKDGGCGDGDAGSPCGSPSCCSPPLTCGGTPSTTCCYSAGYVVHPSECPFCCGGACDTSVILCPDGGTCFPCL